MSRCGATRGTGALTNAVVTCKGKPSHSNHVCSGFKLMHFTWNLQQARSVLAVPYRSTANKR